LGSNTALTYLDVAGNRIESLDISALSKLQILWADWNPFETLDLTHNPDLTRLHIAGSPISALDVSKNTKLKDLVCTSTDITSLDLSQNTDLELLDCRWNNIVTLNVSKNLHLGEGYYGDKTSLYCNQNEDSNGINLLQTLYIAEGQVIPFINDNRSDEHIPPTTSVQVAPPSGGGEGYGGGEQDP
jgi:Leucine-rich repeat (LRR) protein